MTPRWIAAILCILCGAKTLVFSQGFPTRGVLHNESGEPLVGFLVGIATGRSIKCSRTASDGSFMCPPLTDGNYWLSVVNNKHINGPRVMVNMKHGNPLIMLTLSQNGSLRVDENAQAPIKVQPIANSVVSEIPLNKRDLSQILLLAAGSAADPSGASNLTQQFAINGQRGVEATFALDGADISDPEQGGGTFTNFNVDAVLAIESLSGVMPAEVGRGGSGATNISTRAGTDILHGSVFEFIRNSALDARNYFDFSSAAMPRRIPPFKRNEFGLTVGGSFRKQFQSETQRKGYYFLEYQGFRQTLGTTQVLSVPTAQQRTGIDATAFPGDVLRIPVNASIARILDRYPLPNDLGGTFGDSTYAASSPIKTDADQFSVRLDYHNGEADHVIGRVTFDNLDGPTTNPDQTVLDPTFGVTYADRQRNAVMTWVHTVSPRLSFETSTSAIRTTPSFDTPNHSDPAIKFNDSLFEPFNAPGGTVLRSFTNLFQIRENVSWAKSHHLVKAGVEVRVARDSSYSGGSPNGEYDFGGGKAYSPVEISSDSGTHNIHVGDALPDTLSEVLTGSAFAYSRAVASPYVSGGARIGPTADNRDAYEAYIQDSWRMTSNLSVDCGLRLEVYTPLSERAHRSAGIYPTANNSQLYLVNPQPRYRTYMNNWGPRVALNYQINSKLTVQMGGALTTVPQNLWQTNNLTGGLPFVFYPRVTAAENAPVLYGFEITSAQIPTVYSTNGNNIFAGGVNHVPPNTIVDITRLEADLTRLSGQFTPLSLNGVSRQMGNALLGTWSVGLSQSMGGLVGSVSYVGTSAWKLPRMSFPNAYQGATAEFAHFTQFNAEGLPDGGFGTESIVAPISHSSYNSLQMSASGQTGHGGPGLQVSYTFAKSIDDASSVSGTSASSSVGAISFAAPQNPFDNRRERGPSSFDVAHSLSLNILQGLPTKRLPLLRQVNGKITDGWEVIGVAVINSGLPFTVYSGIQQTGVGSAGVDRPDEIERPVLSTSRRRHEDYFGRGANNGSFFLIPINLAGGSGPNVGRFGQLGRNTFRGPSFRDVDLSLTKDTPLGHRESGGDLMTIQFRTEVFNAPNIVNMGLPSNTILGSGFGVINRTAGSSRQIQFSLKVLY